MTAQTEESKLKHALSAMWRFASGLVAKHDMNGDDTMTDPEHLEWQEASGAASNLVGGGSLSFDPWHLYYIEAVGGDDVTGDRHKTFLVSAQSEGEGRAQEMARDAVDDFLPIGWTVEHIRRVCFCGADIWQELSSTA